MSLGLSGERGNGATPDQFLLAGGNSGITPNSNRVRARSKIIRLSNKSMLEVKLVPAASELVELDAVVLGTAAGARGSA